MHPDELRPEDELNTQKTREFISNPEKLKKNYEGLRARDTRNKKKIAELEKRQKQLEKERAELIRLRAEKQDLTKRLGSAVASVEAYRKETKRLKDDLQRLRASKALRLSRAISTSVRAAKSPLAQAKTVSSRQFPSTSPVVQPQQMTESTVEHAPVHEAEVSDASRQVPLSQRSLEILINEFQESPSGLTFFRVINRYWFNHGEIDAPAQFIRDNSDYVSELAEKEKVLVHRILGIAHLKNEGIEVPSRSQGLAYIHEPNRVMYCVHSTPAYNSNGYSTRTRGVARGMKEAGADVVVAARVGYPWDTKADVAKPRQVRSVSFVDEILYSHTPGSNINTAPLNHYIIEAADAFVREARLQRPALIQAASNFRTALPALIAARRLGLPFVYEVRGLWEITEASDKPGWENSERYQLMADMETLVAQEADAVLVITQQVANELIRRGVSAKKIRIAANAVDAHEFLPLPKDEQFARLKQIRADIPVIGFAGSTVPYEGLDTLLEASAELTDREVEHQVVIAGSGSAMAELKELRENLQLENVLFLGRLPMNQIPQLISTFDIMPCPRKSLPVTELVSPLKPLEAFSSGKAVVLSDVAPHIDLAGENERALIFPAGDKDRLADALQELIENPKHAIDVGRKARLWVKDERTWNLLGQKIVEVHDLAKEHYLHSLAPEQKSLSDLRVGLIADEFTTSTLSSSFTVVPISRKSWKTQLDEEKLDLIFIESAWKGNDGEWLQGVGYYGEEESRDVFGVISKAKTLGIPTVFWNKEDPVHFNRFRKTAVRCDHVFTTDANMVVPYLSVPWGAAKTASGLPFYAQPAIHNPLRGNLPFENSVAYAGTYYGERYKERSKQLYKLLKVAQPYGLTIYDRQLAFEDSPYRFPAEFAQDVRGVLPYNQVIDSYKAHVVQLNVNSVTDSPTMFSRRVVEIAACGGVVLSGPGRGVNETFGSNIPASSDARLWNALLLSWTKDNGARVREAWRQMRTIYRSHTVDTALTILARTAGIPVIAPELDSYAVKVAGDIQQVAESILTQSVLPGTIYVDNESAIAGKVTEELSARGIIVKTWGKNVSVTEKWLASVSEPVGRTFFEDLLIATRFGKWSQINYRWATDADYGSSLARISSSDKGLIGLVSTHKDARSVGSVVEMLLAPAYQPKQNNAEDEADAIAEHEKPLSEKTVLVAGHDLKFAQTFIAELGTKAKTVLIDQWDNHSEHDEEKSLNLLQQADVIFCEWGLGNAVWYSKHKLPHQKLIVRVHSQELRRAYLNTIKHSAVDQYVFVGELIRQAAITSHGVPAEKTSVIFNGVNVDSLDLPKQTGSEFNIGMVGIVAQPKRLDRAIDLLEKLHETDTRYRLFIKGKQPSDYPWMLAREDEMSFYNEQYKRIAVINEKVPGSIVFDGFGSDMEQWYQKIGIAISVSDFESFHFTVPDGAASGAYPITLDWPGADLVYPRSWVCSDTNEMAGKILSEGFTTEDRDFVVKNFSQDKVTAQLLSML